MHGLIVSVSCYLLKAPGKLNIVTVVLAIFLVFLVGALMQRVSGMGVGLLAGPVVSLLLGPIEGILVVNLVAAVNGAMGAWSLRRDIEWHKVALIGPVMIFGAITGTWFIACVSTGWLQAIVGALLLVALLTMTVGKNYVPVARGKAPALGAGLFAGFMNTLAGVAGPSITVYALASRWPQRPYAATLQPLFAIAGLLSFIVKSLGGMGDLSGVPPAVWPAGIVACIIGIFFGTHISRYVNREKARNIAITIASLGAVTVFVRGVFELIR